MLSRTAEDAVDRFLEPLRQVAGCITSCPFIGAGYRPSVLPHTAAFAPIGEPVPLDARDGGKSGISVFVSLRYRIAEEATQPRAWRVDLAGYFYRIADREERELLAYHWHPEAVGPSFPHLHISGRLPALDLGPGFAPVALGNMHLPTAHITFAGLVRLLIAEFGVAPQRADWEAALAISEERERARILR